MRSFIAGLLGWSLIALAACVAKQESIHSCIPVKEWSAIEQHEIYIAEKRLQPDSLLIPVLEDYLRMRDEARACR